ncbi:MAG: hypothetical protein HYV97_11065 [Bdellovibrio sp.]|nr:hypothetical protein [Bdellovibrio sp.]
MKKFNLFLTHLLCHCMLFYSIAYSWNAYGLDDQNGLPAISEEHEEFVDTTTGSGNSTGSGTEGLLPDDQTFEDCSQYGDDETAINACNDRNTAKAGQLGGSGTGSEDGLSSADDINAEATHNDIVMALFALLAAFMGAAYIIKCVNQISAYIFSIGAVILIIAEIVGWVNWEQGSKVRLQAVTNTDAKTVGDQTKTLTAAMTQTQKAAEWASSRASWMDAVKGIWTAATVIAIIEGICGVIPVCAAVKSDICVGAFINRPSNTQGLYANFYRPENYDLNAYLGIPSSIPVQVENELQATKFSDFILQTKPIPQTALDIPSQFEFEQKQQEQKTAEAESSFMMQALRNILPDAKADDGTQQTIMDVLMGVAIAAGFITVYYAWSSIAKQGFIRAAFILVMTVFMWWGAAIARDKADKLQARVDAYQKLITALQAAPPGVPGAPAGTTPISGGAGNSAPPISESVAIDPGSGLGGCTSGSGTGMQSNDCSCTTTNSCTTVQIPSNLSIPAIGFDGVDSLTSFGKDTANGANNLARNQGPGKSVVNAGTTAFAAKMKKAINKLKGKYLELAKKKGEKNPRTLENLQKEILTKVKKDLKMMDQKLTPAVLAQLGNVGGGSATNDKIDAKMKEIGVTQLAKSKGVNLSMDNGNSSNGKLFDDEAAVEADVTKAEAVNTADALNGFESTEQDILKDSGVSIFEQLSSRYRKSAFPIFFMKKKDIHGGENSTPPTP